MVIFGVLFLALISRPVILAASVSNPNFPIEPPNSELPEEDICGDNEVFLECGPCELSCEQPHQPCPIQCYRGCMCKKGFFRNGNFECVRLRQCPGRASRLKALKTMLGVLGITPIERNDDFVHKKRQPVKHVSLPLHKTQKTEVAPKSNDQKTVKVMPKTTTASEMKSNVAAVNSQNETKIVEKVIDHHTKNDHIATPKQSKKHTIKKNKSPRAKKEETKRDKDKHSEKNKEKAENKKSKKKGKNKREEEKDSSGSETNEE